jgi:hypothetical protein
MEEGALKTEQTTIRSILSKMKLGPGPEGLSLPKLVCQRLPRHESIRIWRRPQTGHAFKRKDKRFHFVANVLISNSERTIIGKAQNLSDSGMFITTDSTIFTADEELDLIIVPFSAERSYKVRVKVERLNKWPKGTRGYGFSFLE